MKNKKLILFLTLLGVAIMSIPLFMFGVHKSFYVNPDPDIVYATNAVLFLKSGIISYTDHPGTPQIVLLSLLSLPIKLISSIFLHQDFTKWTFNNFEIYTFYLRVFELTISGLSLYLLLKLLDRLNNSKIAAITIFLLFFLTGIFTWSTFVAPEALLILICVIWLLYLFKFIEEPNLRKSLILSGLSGIAFADKFTGIVLFICTIAAIAVMGTKKIKGVFLNIIVFIFSFVIGIIPVFSKLTQISDWGMSLLLHPGVYGQGPITLLNKEMYISSLSTLFGNYPAVFIMIIFGTILTAVYYRKIKSKKDRTMLLLFVIPLAMFFVFCKYPKIHYNYVNLLLISFSMSYFLSKMDKIWKAILMPVFAVLFIWTLFVNITILRNARIIAGGEDNGYMHYALKEWTPFWSGNVYKDLIDDE